MPTGCSRAAGGCCCAICTNSAASTWCAGARRSPVTRIFSWSSPMPEDVVQTPFGKFLVTKGEIIGETTRAGTLWDGPGFLQVIAKEYGHLGEPGITILDVGANQGAFSIWLATQGAWRVLALEPQPEVMRRLKANLDLNRETTAGVVIPLEIAAYAWQGKVVQTKPL